VKEVSFYFSYSIFLAGLLALFRLRRISRDYYPFLAIIWIACFNEALSDLLVRLHKGNYLSSNLYSLAETLLYLALFRSLGLLRSRTWYRGLNGLFLASFLVDILFFNPIKTDYCSYFNIISSFTLVILSINCLNGLLLREKEPMRHPSFWITTGVIIFFTYYIMIEIFWIFGQSANPQFSGRVYDILDWINLLCNSIFIVAILWMRRNQAFTLQF
jgi:hypothetical protein